MKYVQFFILFLLFGCYAANKKTEIVGKEMPNFEILLMDSTSRVETKSVVKGKPNVFIFFSPECPYCRMLTEEIARDIKSLDKIDFYMISNASFRSIRNYYDFYKLGKYSNIIVGQDNDNYFQNYFHPDAVPYIVVYDKEKSLKRVLIGKVKTSLIRRIAYQ